MVKSGLIPKGASTNPSRNIIKIDALKFDIEKPRAHSVFDEIKIIDKRENRSNLNNCLLYTSPSPRDRQKSRMPSSA